MFAAEAGAGQPTAVDLERAAVFAQRMQTAYEEGMSLSLELDGAESYIDSFYAGELERGEFTAALDPFLEDMEAAIRDYRSRYPKAPSPPSIGSPKHEQSLAVFARIVVKLGGLLERQLAATHQLRDAALAGDQAGYDAATADSLALTVEILKTENTSLQASLVAIEQGHPQYGLTKAIMGGNDAMAVAVRVLEAVFRGEGFDAGKFSLEVEAGLQSAERGIVDGERATTRMLRNLEGKFARTEADRYGARFVGELVEAYERAFAVEREILRVERGLLDYLRAVNAGEDTAAESAFATIAGLQSELEQWTTRRTEEQNIRLAMSAEFARNIQTMQE